jgi:DNA-binding response OmpR family regulator
MTDEITLVEDDEAIAKGLLETLELEGYLCNWINNGEKAVETILSQVPDLVLMDLRLPSKDGFSITRELRAQNFNYPIIMLTAKDDVTDRVLGLEMGADDYVIKPFNVRELLSRIKAQLRRSKGDFSSKTPELFTVNKLKIDFSKSRCYLNEQELYLTPTEFRMIQTFIKHEGQSLSRQQIIDHCWGKDYVLEDERTVDVHIRHLREKLGSEDALGDSIQTHRGFGYRFVKKS